jgi:16S rRNA (uracil1498-N3)-methyltransferase
MPRFHVPLPLAAHARLALPAGAARHVQVLRLQPGMAVTLFDGRGGEWDATIARMGRSDVEVEVGAHHAVEREAARAVHLAVGLMAAERMDWLVEKATELGAASLTPVLTSRSSLRLTGERATKNAPTGRPWPWPLASKAAATACWMYARRSHFKSI